MVNKMSTLSSPVSQVQPPVDQKLVAAKLAAESRESSVNEGSTAAAMLADDNYPEGFVIFEGTRDYKVEGTLVRFSNGVVMEHKCTPNCVVVEGRTVANHGGVKLGEKLTVDFNLFMYNMKKEEEQEDSSFDCKCGCPPADCYNHIAGFKTVNDSIKNAKLYLSEPEVRAAAMKDGFEVTSGNPQIRIRPNGDMGQTAYAIADIPKGTKLFHCPGLVVPFITMYTICMREGKHVLFGQGAECIPHHCDPNVKVVVCDDSSFDFVTVKDIAEGDMVSFNYLSSEWTMDGPFNCLCGCGPTKCFDFINGYRNVSEEKRGVMDGIATDFIKKMRELEGFGAEVLAQYHFESGQIIQEGITGFEVTKEEEGDGDKCFVTFSNGTKLPHSDKPTAVYVEGRLVALGQVPKNTPLTVNFSLFVPSETLTAVGAAIKGFNQLPLEEAYRLMYLAEPPVRRAFTAQEGVEIFSSSEYMVVKANGDMGQTTFATKDIEAGVTIFTGTGLVVPFATMYTICVAPKRHLLFADGAQCLAHSCNPNVKIVVEQSSFRCVTLRPIKADEVVAFNYLTTEYEMNDPFACLCGCDKVMKCYGNIAGYKNLAFDRRPELKGQVTQPVLLLSEMDEMD